MNLNRMPDRVDGVENVFFDCPLDRCVDLRAIWQKDLYSIVLIWVMRGTNDDTGVKIKCAGQMCDAWRCHHRGGFTSRIFRRRTGMDRGFDPRTRLAGIAAGDKTR